MWSLGKDKVIHKYGNSFFILWGKWKKIVLGEVLKYFTKFSAMNHVIYSFFFYIIYLRYGTALVDLSIEFKEKYLRYAQSFSLY